MLWCAASARLNEDIEKLGAAGFLESDRDIEILRIYSERLGILTERRSDTLRRCLGDRNNCAHPSGELYGAAEVIGYLQDLNQALFGYPLSLDSRAFRKILLTEDPLSPEQAGSLVASLRVNKRSRRLPHVLIDMYFSSGPRVREKIRLVWQAKPSAESEESQERRLKEHLSLSEQEQVAVMRHLARKLRGLNRERNFHQPAEIAQLIFWEALCDDEASAAIYEYFLSQGEHLTLALARTLRKYAPDGYREQLDALFGAP